MQPSGDSLQEPVTRLLIEWKKRQQGSSRSADAAGLQRAAAAWQTTTCATSGPQPRCSRQRWFTKRIFGLVAQNLPDWESRSHFFGVAAHLMRQILVDHARKRRSAKRGSGAEKVSIEEAVSFAPGRGRDIEALDDALNALAEIDPRKAKVIELRFFGGFSVEETGQALGISVATVGREQRMAEAWLHREVSRTEGQQPAT